MKASLWDPESLALFFRVLLRGYTASMKKAPLWTCPKCGKKLVGKNMSHSCVRRTMDEFFAGKDPQSRKLFEAFLKLARQCGPVRADVAKTRIALQARTRFAALDAITKDGVLFHIWLKHKITSPRFIRVELYKPSNYVHYFRVADPRELDDEVLEWLKQGYKVGMQEY